MSPCNWCLGLTCFILIGGGLSLSLWISIHVIPDIWLPMFRTYKLGVDENCLYFNGTVVPWMCIGYVNYPCFAVQAGVQTSLQVVWPVFYQTCDAEQECWDAIQRMPFIEVCRVNQCHADFAGERPSNCLEEEAIPVIIPKDLRGNLGGLMVVYVFGLLPYLIPVIFIGMICHSFLEPCFRRKNYQQIQGA
jgi:hypothetical protein